MLTNVKIGCKFRCMLIELIRKQIKSSGKRRAEISRETGVEEAVLCRIMKGGSCKAETVDALLHYFGFEIVHKKGKTKTRKGR